MTEFLVEYCCCQKGLDSFLNERFPQNFINTWPQFRILVEHFLNKILQVIAVMPTNNSYIKKQVENEKRKTK